MGDLFKSPEEGEAAFQKAGEPEGIFGDRYSKRRFSCSSFRHRLTPRSSCCRPSASWSTLSRSLSWARRAS